ncbi:MAG: galactose mutarotase [Clostridiales bacterium]|nr:galactose mutarotase [Clostridiales bacterium]
MALKRKVGTKMELICEKLTNKNGMEVTLLNLGAAIISVSVPGPDGSRADLVLGYGKAEDYMEDRLYFGSTPGRFANRIGGARFSLNGTEHVLTANEGRNQLHGGATGFAKKIWETERDGGRVTFTYRSPDGDNGYPGNLTACAAYSLNDENELSIEYTAESDADTVINLTNHSYFNLGGGADTILDHMLSVNADSFIVTDRENIPTGEIRDTAGGALDFSEPKTIGDAVSSNEEAVTNVNGVDSCFSLRGEGLRSAAVLSDPVTGRTLEVLTDLPGIQAYTSQGIPEGTKGRDGIAYGPYSGICLEAQHFPDAPNQPGFPSAVLEKGTVFRATIVFRFKAI